MTKSGSTKDAGKKMRSGPGSFDDALKMLDSALGGRAKPLAEIAQADLGMIQREIASTFSQVSGDVMQSVVEVAGNLKDASLDNLIRFSDFSEESFNDLAVKGREIFDEADERLRKNPWPFIGGVAVGTLALGFVVGSRTGKPAVKASVAGATDFVPDLSPEVHEELAREIES